MTSQPRQEGRCEQRFYKKPGYLQVLTVHSNVRIENHTSHALQVGFSVMLPLSLSFCVCVIMTLQMSPWSST